MKPEIKIQTAYDYLKNHQDLTDFEIKIDDYGQVEIIDKRTLEFDNNTFKDYSLFINMKNGYSLKFVSTLGYRDYFTSENANKLHSKGIKFEIYKNMIYLYFDNKDKNNLDELVNYIKFMADYILDFD